MSPSLESSRPIMAPSKRASVRYSTYSISPSVAPTVQSSRSTSSTSAEITKFEQGLDRMENRALTQQRVMLSEEKSDYFSKLALGAKLERALDRRFTSQDAVMRKKKTRDLEKVAVVGEKA